MYVMWEVNTVAEMYQENSDKQPIPAWYINLTFLKP